MSRLLLSLLLLAAAGTPLLGQAPDSPPGGPVLRHRIERRFSERIKQDLGRVVRVEGLPVADWVLIDAQDVIVHIFRPEVRSFYNLERMWGFEGGTAAVGA